MAQKPRIDRLRVLSTFIRSLPDERWSYRYIVENNDSVSRKIKELRGVTGHGYQEILEGGRGSCGTTACAIGWAPTAHADSDPSIKVVAAPLMYGGHRLEYAANDTGGKSLRPMHFAQEYYSISGSESEYLFAFPNWAEEHKSDDEYATRIDYHGPGRITPTEYVDCDLVADDVTDTRLGWLGWDATRRQLADHIDAYCDQVEAWWDKHKE